MREEASAGYSQPQEEGHARQHRATWANTTVSQEAEGATGKHGPPLSFLQEGRGGQGRVGKFGWFNHFNGLWPVEWSPVVGTGPEVV